MERPELRMALEDLFETKTADIDVSMYLTHEPIGHITDLFRELFEERKTAKDLGRRLLEWAQQTGGWDAPVWRELQQLVTGSQIGIQWDIIEKEMPQQEWFEEEPGLRTRQMFIGTVMALTPSGKFYTPWANSNVEVCEICANASDAPCDEDSACSESTGDPLTGEGHCEVCRDAAWRQQLEKEADQHGYFVTSGEGDPATCSWANQKR